MGAIEKSDIFYFIRQRAFPQLAAGAWILAIKA
jgi:hypothetical protein